ncbi:MAG: glycoside hydrolase family 30 protein [Bacilli bacterium]|jgi:glucosylceramidase
MIKVIQSTREKRNYWQEVKADDFSAKCRKKLTNIQVFTERKYQSVLGFGGAFTEAACFNIMSASPHSIEKIMRAYYATEGLNYSLGRTVINSCDFSLDSYSYVQEGDQDFSSFDLSREQKYVIPVIDLAKAIAGKSLTLVASPWSPPAYMKTNDSMLYGGSLKGKAKPLWAKYIARYLQEMRKRNIAIEYLTVQNEPEAAQTWESCLFTGQEEADFILKHLAPTLKENGLANVKILAWDHNRDHILNRADAIYDNPETRALVWGLAYHWYVSSAHENLSLVHDKYPDKHLLFTEGCLELNNAHNGLLTIGLWEHGEYYGRHMINDFNNFCEGWIDWNLVVDEIGGPNHVNNFCEAPIIYNRSTREIIYNPSYYYIGHFSKYVMPGAVRLHTELHHSPNVLAVSFRNPNGEIITIIQNEGHRAFASLHLEGQGTALQLPAHSITTIIMHK